MIPHVLERILIIDDEPSMVRALARLLARDGYIVATARNGRHALAALQGQGYDVILCDLRMPELDGRAFYTQLQQRAPLLCQRVLFLTDIPGIAAAESRTVGESADLVCAE
jgi:CheY-like chemotaxis protein